MVGLGVIGPGLQRLPVMGDSFLKVPAGRQSGGQVVVRQYRVAGDFQGLFETGDGLVKLLPLKQPETQGC